MRFPVFSPWRLAGAAAVGVACAAAVMPAAALAASRVPGAAPAAATEPVPASFRPMSASFLSPTRGYVLGTTGCQQLNECRARLVATMDGGARWHFVAAPGVRLFDPAGDQGTQAFRVSGAVFASQQVGWLYGPGLWVTRDGGARWRKISLTGIVPSLGGGVMAMAVSSAAAYAVVAPDPFHGRPWELYSSPLGRDAWARVGTMAGTPGASLAVSGKAAWFGTATRLWATTNGTHWRQDPAPCPASDADGLGSIAAASPSHVVFLCLGDGAAGSMGKQVLTSSDGGKTVHLAGQAPISGTGGTLGVPPRNNTVITLATASSASFLDRSGDGGKTWTELTDTSGGAPWASLSYVSPTTGWVVLAGPPIPGTDENVLLQTQDAGGIWTPVNF